MYRSWDLAGAVADTAIVIQNIYYQLSHREIVWDDRTKQRLKAAREDLASFYKQLEEQLAKEEI